MTSHSKKAKKHPRAETADASFHSVSKTALIGALTSVAVMAALALICSALCMLSSDPSGLTMTVGIVIFYISALAGGGVAAGCLKRHRSAALVSAALCGFIISLLTGICAVLQSQLAPELTHGISIGISLLLRALAIPVSMLSCYILLINKTRRTHRRR